MDNPQMPFPLPPSAYIKGRYSINKGPPAIPNNIDEKGYRCFGEQRKISETTPSLDTHGVTVLYDDSVSNNDIGKELSKLLRLAEEKVMKFLAMIGSSDSVRMDMDECETIGQDLTNVYLNMMYLVNEYRPHQAREMILEIKRKQIEARKQLAGKIRSQIADARTGIAGRLDQMKDGGQIQLPLAPSPMKALRRASSTSTTSMDDGEDASANAGCRTVSIPDYLSSLLDS